MGGILKIFGGGDKTPPVSPAPPAPPAPLAPAIDDKGVKAEAEAERLRQRKAAGRASTDLTGGLLDEAPTAKKYLLG